MSDLQTCRIVWRKHAEQQAVKRKKSKAGVEAALRSASALIPVKEGRHAVYGCVDGSWTQIIVKMQPGLCIVRTVIPKGRPC